MGKRKKTVFNNQGAVAHAWALQSQDYGTDSKRRFYFEGPSIYSYGSHFEIGRFVNAPNGERVVLFTTDRYSSTTSTHQSIARSAVRHNSNYSIPYLDDLERSANVLAANLETDCLDYFCQSKPWDGCISRFIERALELNNFIRTFNLKEPRVQIPDTLLELMQDHIKYRKARRDALNTPEMIAKREAEAEKRAEAKERKERKALEQRIADWRAGGSGYLHGLSKQILRIKGDEIQTSGGASVPLNAGIELLKRIKSGTAIIGTQIGEYTLNKYNAEYVWIGCHTIEIAEAEGVLLGRPTSSQPGLALVKGGQSARV